MLVDFDFIKRLEGSSLVGYVPDYQNSKSGVTIASGFDIGSRKRRYIKTTFEPALAKKLVPYCGIRGLSARLMTSFMPLVITESEARSINEIVQAQALSKLLKSWKSATPIKFDSLSIEQRTVVASVAFQYGSLAARAPKFWHQVTSGDWVGAMGNLRNFGDRYDTRREVEADFLEKGL